MKHSSITLKMFSKESHQKKVIKIPVKLIAKKI